MGFREAYIYKQREERLVYIYIERERGFLEAF